MTGSIVEEIIHLDFCSEEMKKRVILTPTNKSSLTLNNEILNRLPGDSSDCFSCDTAVLVERNSD